MIFVNFVSTWLTGPSTVKSECILQLKIQDIEATSQKGRLMCGPHGTFYSLTTKVLDYIWSVLRFAVYLSLEKASTKRLLHIGHVPLLL